MPQTATERFTLHHGPETRRLYAIHRETFDQDLQAWFFQEELGRFKTRDEARDFMIARSALSPESNPEGQ